MSGNGNDAPGPFVIRHAAEDGARRIAPAATRNTAPILEMLGAALDDAGLAGKRLRALELAAGTGQHAAAIARAMPHIVWQPSDADAAALESIAAWRDHVGLENLAEPVELDLEDAGWTERVDDPLDLIFAANLMHISPWTVTQSLLAGAARLLGAGGIAFVYGCFTRDGDWISDSNRAFDASLKARDARWGVRDTAEVSAEAARHGLCVRKVIAMPANNTVMVFAHQSSSSS